MSAYRSDVSKLERRIHDLEDELAALGEDDDVPLARQRRVRDARVRLLTGLMMLVAGPVIGFWVGAISGTYATHARRPPPRVEGAPAAEDLPTRWAEDRRAKCNAAVRLVERDLHACEVELGEELADDGVSVVGHGYGDCVPSTAGIESALARYAAPVLTCRRGPTSVTLRFGPDGQVASADFDPSSEVPRNEQACIRAAIQPVTVPFEARGLPFVATFGLPKER